MPESAKRAKVPRKRTKPRGATFLYSYQKSNTSPKKTNAEASFAFSSRN